VVRLNQNGSLDTTFDGDGIQTFDFGGDFENSTANVVAIHPNGEIVVAGQIFRIGTEPSLVRSVYAVARLTEDGRLDNSFDGDGRRIIELEGRIEDQTTFFETGRPPIAGIAFEPNGKIVVAGISSDLNLGNDDFTVFRLNKDGSLDTSFDGDGWQTIDFNSVEATSSMARQPDGKIVVVGSTASLDFAVARLNQDGSLDTSFDYDGKQIIDFGMDDDIANDVALQPDGKIVVVGTAGDREGSTHFALARLVGKDTKKSPTISINDVERVEGHSGTTPFTFTVRLSDTSKETVTVKYRTAAGSTSTGLIQPDYKDANGTLTFAPGETTKTVTVLVYGDRYGEVNGDRLDEAFETFFVLLSQPTNAAIADDRGLGAIVDDDIRILISDVAQTEGPDGQTTLFTFTLTFSAAFDDPVTIFYETVDFSTDGDEDYVYQNGELYFAPGETTQTITIEVIGDSAEEHDEEFAVLLSAEETIFLSLIKPFGVGTILNDD
jgi:uncharacterized delta-60 repeat protein